jgi:hypothetical protein
MCILTDITFHKKNLSILDLTVSVNQRSATKAQRFDFRADKLDPGFV